MQQKQSIQSFQPQSDYNLFFLQRNDERRLNLTQQKQVLSNIKKHLFHKSAYLYNSNQVKRRVRKFKKQLSWITPFYAVKSNSNQQLLKDLLLLGSSFDCASKTEIQTVLKLGAKSHQIIYSNPVKDQNDLSWAYSHGINITTADTIDELQKIQKHAKNMEILWRISIKQIVQRVQKGAMVKFSQKFGNDIQQRSEIENIMKQIKKFGVSLKGISFHSGSGQNGSLSFEYALKIAKLCMVIGRQCGHQMKILNMGGGFPAGQLSEKLIQILKITEDDPLGFKVYAEPGRHFCSYAFYLLAKILGKRVKYNTPCYHVNESCYHSFNCISMAKGLIDLKGHDKFYSSIHSITQQIKIIEQKHQANIFGMSTSSKDIIAKKMNVPANLNVYDWICVSGMGAYTFGQKTTFCGMESLTKTIQWPTLTDKQEDKKQ